MPLAPGARLGCYEILAPLGAGGMGEVYRARDTRLDREVALKTLPEHLAQTPEALARFEREAKAVAALSHPNIVTLFDVGAEHGVAYVVTELLEGETLRQRAGRQALRPQEAAEIGGALAEGLSAAHQKGIIHRDLKPENVFLTSDGRVKILDFGLARREAPEGTPASEAVTRTEPGRVLGTVGYMSPEQVRGEHADARSDLFSLGCVLHEMLTGRRTFARPSVAETLAAILKEDPAPLPGAPQELGRVVRRCLEKDPRGRFQSAREVEHALRAVPGGRAGPVRWRRWAVATALGAMLVALAVLFLYPRLKPAAAIESLAVLPFVSAGGDSGGEYLGDGIAESIIRGLSRVPKLKVMSFSSVARLKGPGADPQQAGQKLKVQAVLAGRVVQRGDDLSISAELVKVADGSQLWGEQYRRRVADIFAVQEEIGREISEQLRLGLTREQQQQLAKRHTQNLAAYQEYLKGRYFWSRRTAAALKTAIAHFEKAIALDPAYALAYSGLADCHTVISAYAAIPPREAYARARVAAEKALELDPTLGEALASLGALKLINEWEWEGGNRDLLRAQQLSPGHASAHQWRALYLLPMGRAEEALSELRRAHELDPLSLLISTRVGDALYAAGRYQEATEQYRQTLALEPNFGQARLGLAKLLVQQGKYAEALAELRRAAQLSEGDPYVLANLAYACALAGRKAEAREILADLEERSRRGYFPSLALVVVCIGLGEKDRAFEWLRKSVEERDVNLCWLRLDPQFAPLRSDARFAELLRLMKLKP